MRGPPVAQAIKCNGSLAASKPESGRACQWQSSYALRMYSETRARKRGALRDTITAGNFYQLRARDKPNPFGRLIRSVVIAVSSEDDAFERANKSRAARRATSQIPCLTGVEWHNHQTNRANQHSEPVL